MLNNTKQTNNRHMQQEVNIKRKEKWSVTVNNMKWICESLVVCCSHVCSVYIMTFANCYGFFCLQQIHYYIKLLFSAGLQ